MDKISITGLEVFARHGVAPEENVLGQKFVISADLFTDLSAAGKKDDLGAGIDYSKICHDIKGFAEDNTFRLIETVAERLADMLLTKYPPLDRVRLKVGKPWAQVAVHLETISAEIERGRHTAYIALGSNMGDKEAWLRFAVSELDNAPGCKVTRVSGFIETEPYGFAQQDMFLNGCLRLETLLTPLGLLELAHKTEYKAGRERHERWGPRTLDVDIIFYDDIVISCDTLRIPHADMHNREFVLAPLCEIAPYMLHPVLRKTAAELLEELRKV